jgi:hypothetical protein
MCPTATEIDVLGLSLFTFLQSGIHAPKFRNCKVVDASELIIKIPMCTEMFQGCTSLMKGPKILPSYVVKHSYQRMFKGCTSLTVAPELSALELSEDCYYDMFNGCTSLTKAPDLPAPILVAGCYTGIFQNCSNLNYIKILAIEIASGRPI